MYTQLFVYVSLVCAGGGGGLFCPSIGLSTQSQVPSRVLCSCADMSVWECALVVWACP